jgi:hypothetical protein
VVVDADTTVASQGRQVLNHAGLAAGCGALARHTQGQTSRQAPRQREASAFSSCTLRGGTAERDVLHSSWQSEHGLTCSRMGKRRGTAARARFLRFRFTDSTSTNPTRRVAGSSTVVSTQGNAPRVSQKPCARKGVGGCHTNDGSGHNNAAMSWTKKRPDRSLSLHRHDRVCDAGFIPTPRTPPPSTAHSAVSLSPRPLAATGMPLVMPCAHACTGLAHTCTRTNSFAAAERPPGCRTSFFPLLACFATSRNPGTRASSALRASADAGSSWVKKLVHRPCRRTTQGAGVAHRG